MKYRREIDGLRAVAIVPVILFHAGLTLFSGGYVGVDVFFVISGYLITTILIDELEAGRFSIARFYERRARRILPALFLVMACCIPFAWLWMLPNELKAFLHSLVAVVLFSSNILFWREDGYFAAAAELKPLLHTWSLAVEEQYYLVFPVFLALMWRFGRRRIVWSIVALAGASLLASEWGWRNAQSANFYLAPMRAWELLVGSLCAFWLSTRSPLANNWLGLAGLGMIVFAILAYDSSTPFPSLYALVPVCGAALVIVCASAETWAGRLLGMRAFVGIGLISYSAYLWHQPLFAFARIRSEGEPGPLIMGGLVLLGLLLAYLSWRYVEKPFRKGHSSPLQTRQGVFLASAAGIAVFASFGIIGHVEFKRVKAVWLQRNPSIAPNYTLIENAREFQNFGARGEALQHFSECRFNVRDLDSAVEQTLERCASKFGGGTLVLGDSHGIDFYGVLSSRFSGPFLVGLTKEFCRAHDLEKSCSYQELAQFIKIKSNIFNSIYYMQAGFYLMKGRNGEPGSRSIFEKVGLADRVEGIEPDAAHVQAVYSYLDELAPYAKVRWVGPWVEPHMPERLVVKRGCSTDYALRPGQEDAFRKLDTYLGEQQKSHIGVGYISGMDMFKFAITRDFCGNGLLNFRDGDHFSAAGEAYFGTRLPDSFLQ